MQALSPAAKRACTAVRSWSEEVLSPWTTARLLTRDASTAWEGRFISSRASSTLLMTALLSIQPLILTAAQCKSMAGA
eukprot:4115849-Prymnesium_polylepis.1